MGTDFNKNREMHVNIIQKFKVKSIFDLSGVLVGDNHMLQGNESVLIRHLKESTLQSKEKRPFQSLMKHLLLKGNDMLVTLRL